MQKLEKILKEINEASFPLKLLGGDTRFITVSLVEEIIREHMNEKNKKFIYNIDMSEYDDDDTEYYEDCWHE